jgi:hypothetical protein
MTDETQSKRCNVKGRGVLCLFRRRGMVLIQDIGNIRRNRETNDGTKKEMSRKRIGPDTGYHTTHEEGGGLLRTRNHEGRRPCAI